MKPSGLLLMLVAGFVFIAGGAMGFSMLTSSADTAVPAPTCAPRTIEPGEDVTPNLVTVNVYNASRTAGLANRVSVLLQRRGFLTGTVANNPTDVETNNIVILASDESDPRVAVVEAQFSGKVTIQPPPPTLDPDGVSVLVGRNYATKGLSKKGEEAKAEADRRIDVCLPILPIS